MAPDEAESVSIDINDDSTWPMAMTPKEVAQVLRISEQTVARRIREKKIPVSGSSHMYRVSKRWLVGFIDGAHTEDADAD